jgi:hypothetical protein
MIKIALSQNSGKYEMSVNVANHGEHIRICDSLEELARVFAEFTDELLMEVDAEAVEIVGGEILEEGISEDRKRELDGIAESIVDEMLR